MTRSSDMRVLPPGPIFNTEERAPPAVGNAPDIRATHGTYGFLFHLALSLFRCRRFRSPVVADIIPFARVQKSARDFHTFQRRSGFPAVSTEDNHLFLPKRKGFRFSLASSAQWRYGRLASMDNGGSPKKTCIYRSHRGVPICYIIQQGGL